ncbi:MAG: hypothetical protein KJO07_05595 [Deltaproteobacteria bacterium]|nr:hypothetical protein [Deltaproteobacteria bacterium]
MMRVSCALLLALATAACAGVDDESVEGTPLGFPDAGVPDDPEQPDDPEDNPDDVLIPLECDPGFFEDEGACVVDPDARWDVVVIDGAFTPQQPDGGNWDISGGSPDGYVYIEFGSAATEVETNPDNEKLTPAWNATLIWAVSAEELRSNFYLRLLDDDPWDPLGDDLMADCTLPLPDSVFDADAFNANEVDSSCPDVNLALRFAAD